MPASSSDNIVQIEATLKSSLAGEDNLDSKLLSFSKQVLLHKIDFKPAEKPYSLQVNSLRAKYIPLNQTKNYDQNDQNVHKKGSKMNGEGEDCLPIPKVILYPEEKVALEWKKIQKIGAGLVNMGNTCFLNSTLQCLTYTAPLVNYCLSNEHTMSCKQAGFCMMCELQRHVKRCYENSGNAIKPQSVLQKLRMIAKHMHWGRQEDAHEFLRYVVDALQRACLNGHSKLDKFSKETTVINQIFGGFLRSQVQCLKCKERSNTYDPFLDISLEIKMVQTLEKALEKYVHPETLDNDNAYMCTKCRQKVPAHKRFSIHKAPNVLTISLKRFDYNRLMGKVSRHIQFPEKLDLRPYMSVKQGEKVLYQLYAVLVHSGFSCNSGHYYCYVKSPSQIWYCMNDSMIQQVSASRVMSAEAYLLFYSKYKPPGSKPMNPIIGPNIPANHVSNKKFKVNGVISDPSIDIGSSVARKPSSSSGSVQDVSHKPVIKCTTPLPDKCQRERVAFGIKSASTIKDSQQTVVDEKPRIVMQIKNGKVTTFEKSPNGKSKIVKDSERSKSTLVPYGDDSDSDTENHVASSAKQEEKKCDSKNIRRHLDDSAVIFDKKLNATTSVPGNSNLLFMKENTINGSYRRLDGLNLMVSRSRDLNSPDKSSNLSKKTLSDNSNISCLTSMVLPGGSKLNSTTTWQVSSQDSAPSPSVGSSSSRDSVNSTTEWHVSDKIPQYPKIPERQFPGWKVSENDKNGMEEKAKETSSEERCTVENKNSNAETVDKRAGVHLVEKEMNTENNYVDVSDKQKLLSDMPLKENNDKRSHKKHKKHKKHKREHSDVKYKELVNESDSSNKKHKKKKRKHDVEYEQTKRHCNGEESHHKKSTKDSPEFEWVEKTKDSLMSSKSDTGVEQTWDYHVKDGYKRHKPHDTKSSHSWDGVKTSKVTEELEKLGSHGYGDNILSWNGGCSSLDQEVDHQDRKRSWGEAYDEEFDKGKVKKVKQHRSEHDFSQPSGFQRVQDERNKHRAKNHRGSYGSSGYHGSQNLSRHHGHHSDHYHRDSYRSYHYQSNNHYKY